ncbi:MAG: hypothetical protein ACRYFV_17600 [Janthinobacterium lividum]
MRRKRKPGKATLYGKIAAHGIDTLEVADAVSQLIARPAGTRPFHTSVNPITDNVQQDYVATRQAYSAPGRGAWG